MATTDQVRNWYPQWVTNHADRGKKGFQPQGSPKPSVVIEFPKQGGGVWSLPVHALCAEAFEAYAFVMRHFGVAMAPAGGIYNRRNISGTNMPSLHAYGVAIDLPPNGYKPAGFQAAVLAMRTKSGMRVWRNLAEINDRMHDQIDCPPAALATGIDWTTVAGYTQQGGGGAMPDHIEATSVEATIIRADRIYETGERVGVDSTFESDWDWMLSRSIATAHTEPDSVVRSEELAAFLTRLDRQLISPLAARVTALEARIAHLELAGPPTSDPTVLRTGDLVRLTRDT